MSRTKSLGTDVRKLPVKLTEGELLAKGREIAQIEADINEVEAEKKAATDDFKTRIGHFEMKRADVSRHIREGIEFREVEVEHVLHVAAGEVRTIRRDTGEEIATRPATRTELQVEMFPAKAEA